MKKATKNRNDQPTPKLNFFFWKVRMESKLLKNEMKGVKLTSYEYLSKLLKGSELLRYYILLVSVVDVILS